MHVETTKYRPDGTPYTAKDVLANPARFGLTWEQRQWSTKAGSIKVEIRRQTPSPVVSDWKKFGEAFPNALMHHATANMRVMSADVAKKAVADAKDDDFIKTRVIENFLGINHRGGATQKVLVVPASIDESTMKILASANPGVKIIREAASPQDLDDPRTPMQQHVDEGLAKHGETLHDDA